MNAQAPATHRANVVDVEQLESIVLEDFVAYFDSVHLPQDRSPTDTELQMAADEFLASLRLHRRSIWHVRISIASSGKRH